MHAAACQRCTGDDRPGLARLFGDTTLSTAEGSSLALTVTA